MKKLLISAIVAQLPLLLLANSNLQLLEEQAKNGDARSAYLLAKEYEVQSDMERAMLWYKQAAILNFEPKAKQNSKELESSIVQQLQKIERTEAVYGSVFDSYKDDETKNSVKQMVTKTFDIAPYKTNYILPATYDNVTHENREHQETKFQLSIQKSLVDNLFGFNESFVAAYTQTSWWQTSAESAPFRETNYQPELYIIMPHFDKESFIKAYQVGILHESNGQDDPKSRSWNRLYAKAYFQAGSLVVSPRVWYRIPESASTDNNPDIDKYLGYGDLELIYPWKKQTFKVLVKNNFRAENNRGAVQFDWTFPLWEQSLFGYIQLYSGYAESLIDYDKRTDRIGIGFALSR